MGRYAVKRCQQLSAVPVELVDDQGQIIAVVAGFLRYLSTRGCSPNTLSGYAHDLLHFYQFLACHGLTIDTFCPAESLALLEYLRQLPSRRPSVWVWYWRRLPLDSRQRVLPPRRST